MNDGAYTLQRFERIEPLREIWQMLYAGNPRLSPFQSYEFCAEVARDYRFSRQRVFLKPVFFLLCRDGQPRIILPLWRKNAWSYYLLPDFMITPYRDLVWCADCTPEDFAQAFGQVKAALGGAALHLRRINERSALYAWLVQREEPENPKPCVRIEFAQGYAAWRGSLSKNTRQNLRTAENRLARAGLSAELLVDAGGCPSEAVWRQVIRVHRKRYAIRDGERLDPVTNWIRRRHDPIETMLRASGMSFLARLTIGGGLAAFFSGLLTGDGRGVSVCRLSIDDDYDAYSPGALLLARSIERLSRTSGIRTLDLCYGGQPYKYRMGGIESLDWDFTL